MGALELSTILDKPKEIIYVADDEYGYMCLISDDQIDRFEKMGWRVTEYRLSNIKTYFKEFKLECGIDKPSPPIFKEENESTRST